MTVYASHQFVSPQKTVIEQFALTNILTKESVFLFFKNQLNNNDVRLYSLNIDHCPFLHIDKAKKACYMTSWELKGVDLYLKKNPTVNCNKYTIVP